MTKTTIRNLIIILAIAVTGVACSDSSTGNDNRGQDPAAVEGRVDNTSSSSQKVKYKQVEGAVVTAATVDAEGNIQTIGNTETTTNAQGEFALNIDADAIANASDRVVIVAEKNGQTAKAFVTSKVESGATVGIQPITFESSAEASVYQEVVANSDEDVVTKADIEVTVNTDVATDIESNTSTAADVATALAAQAEAQAKFYSEQGIEVTQAQKDEIVQTKADAQVQLENELRATTNAEDEKAAFDMFAESVAKAQIEAGVEASAAAEAWESSSRLLVEESAKLSSNVQKAMRRQTSSMLTFALDAAIRAELQAAGAAQITMDDASDAAGSLRADIDAMADASESKIDSAFTDFNNKIEALISSDAQLKGEFFSSVNAEINGENSAKSTLETSLDGLVDINGMMSAYSNFFANVKSTVQTTFAGSDNAEVEAYTQLLVLINIAS